MSNSYNPNDFLSPSDDNPWMLEAAKNWVAEAKGEHGDHDAGTNIFAWTTKNPEAAFGVIQTILKLTEADEALFDLAGSGPVESFLSICPDDFIELVFKVARNDPRLRRSFQHVWRGGMSEERLKEVKRYSQQKT